MLHRIDLAGTAKLSSTTVKFYEDKRIYIAIGSAGRGHSIPIITFQMWGVCITAGADSPQRVQGNKAAREPGLDSGIRIRLNVQASNCRVI